MVKSRTIGSTVGRWAKDHIMVLICVILVAVCSLASPRFLTVSNIFSILKQNSVIGILAIGECIVIIAGGVDSSIAYTMVACVMILGKLQTMPLWVLVLIALACGFLFGLIPGVAAAYFNVVPFIATMATGIITEGIALIVNYGKPISWGGIHSEFTDFLGRGTVGPVPIMVIGFFLLAIVGQTVLSYTRLGFNWRAIGGNAQAAYWCGVKSKLYQMLSHAFAGMMAGIAALFMIARVVASDPTAGCTSTPDAMAAAVLGGTFIGGQGHGSILGAILGTFMLGMITNIFNLIGLSSYAQYIVKGFVILLAVVLGSNSVASKKI